MLYISYIPASDTGSFNCCVPLGPVDPIRELLEIMFIRRIIVHICLLCQRSLDLFSLTNVTVLSVSQYTYHTIVFGSHGGLLFTRISYLCSKR